MKPTDAIGKRKLALLHAHFRRIGAEATEAVRDEIEALSGQRSSKGLSEAQGWDLLQRLSEQAGWRNPEPITVAWCPVYTPGRVEAGGMDAATRLPSQAQVWSLYHLLREAGIRDPQAYLAKRFAEHAPGGILRTALAAWLVSKSLRRQAHRPARSA